MFLLILAIYKKTQNVETTNLPQIPPFEIDFSEFPSRLNVHEILQMTYSIFRYQFYSYLTVITFALLYFISLLLMNLKSIKSIYAKQLCVYFHFISWFFYACYALFACFLLEIADYTTLISSAITILLSLFMVIIRFISKKTTRRKSSLMLYVNNNYFYTRNTT